MNLLRNVAEYLTPVLTTSQFMEQGFLTPEEFVMAGDQLVFTTPSWQWSGGNAAQMKPYLPPEKQFLITKNVPSYGRVANMMQENTGNERDIIEEDNENENTDEKNEATERWLQTHIDRSIKNEKVIEDNLETLDLNSHPTTTADDGGAKIESEIQLSNPSSSSSHDTIPTSTATRGLYMSSHLENPHSKPTDSSSTDALPHEDDQIPEVDLFQTTDAVIRNVEAEDENTVRITPYLRVEEPEETILRTRTYDISITYDHYYRTPRVFLVGYDDHHHQLSSTLIMQDIDADHAYRTVTVENHPHLSVTTASIHPCKHASVMKKLVSQMNAHGQNVDVKQYLIIFLKFISTVIPTIEYDYTMQ